MKKLMALIFFVGVVFLVAAPALASDDEELMPVAVSAATLEDVELEGIVGSSNKFEYVSNIDGGKSSGSGGGGAIAVYIGRAVVGGAAAKAGADLYDYVRNVANKAANRARDWIERQRLYTKQIEARDHYR